MGAILCCMRPSQPPTNPGEAAATCSTINAITKSPATAKKRVYEFEEDRADRLTLKDWLLAKSPNNNLGHHSVNYSTKLQHFNARSQPTHVMMSSPEVQNVEFYTPRISFPKLDDDDEYEGSRFTPILNRNGSEKLKKKVSFRFPQEADTFIFYSPKHNFEDN